LTFEHLPLANNGPVLYLFTSDIYLAEMSMVDPEEGPRESPLSVQNSNIHEQNNY